VGENQTANLAPKLQRTIVLRILSYRWLGLPPQDGRLFALGTAVTALGDERETRVITRLDGSLIQGIRRFLLSELVRAMAKNACTLPDIFARHTLLFGNRLQPELFAFRTVSLACR